MATLKTLTVKLVGETGHFTYSMNQAAKHAKGTTLNISQSFQSVGAGAVAMGNLIASGVQAGLGALVGLGKEALTAYAAQEQLALSVQTLTARELMNADASLTMAEAMSQATAPAQEMLGWIEKLAIKSPFTSEAISSVLQLSMSFGATSKEAQRLTQNLIDYGSATGKGADVIERMALSLGQVRANGKLTGQDVRELALAGLPVKNILAKSFKTTQANIEKMITKGLIPADKALEAISQSIEKDFSGAAERSGGTMQGLLSTLEDIKTVGLREFFSGTFKAIQPYIQQFADALTSEEFRAGIQQAGAAVGNFVSNAIQGLAGVVRWVQENWPQIRAYIEPIINSISERFQVIVSWVTENWGKIRPILEGAFTGLRDLITGNTQGAIDAFAPIWNTFWNETVPAAWTTFKQAFQITWDLFWGTIAPRALTAFTQAMAVLWWQFWNVTVPAAWTTFKQLFQLAWDQFWGTTVPRAWNTFRQIIAIAWTQFWGTTLPNAFETFKAFIASLPEKFVEVGKQIIAGIVEGIRQFGNKVLTALGDVVNQAIEDVKARLGIQSPSKVFADFGQQMMAGLAVGISGGARLPGVALNAAVEGLTPRVNGVASAGQFAGAAPIVVNVNAAVSNGVDVDALAWRVAQAIQARR